MNNISQKDQMDINVRLCQREQCPYTLFVSVFLFRAESENLVEAFNEGIIDLSKEKMLTSLIDVGSCSLHIVSGALKTGDVWKIGNFLLSFHRYLFHHSPGEKQYS